MNWKNITLEQGFIKQEIDLNGVKAVNYIPLNQVDSFGVTSLENKRWLYASIFLGLCTLGLAFSNQGQSPVVFGIVTAFFVGVYLLTRQTLFTITSSQTKLSVKIMTSKDEIQAVNDFILQIKQSIHSAQLLPTSKAA